jgi:hypothetical protein
MKQIEKDIVHAVKQHHDFRSEGRSSYCPGLTGDRDKLMWARHLEFRYELWGNAIAFGNAGHKKLYVSTCGYPTPTTASRLNAVFAGFDIPMSVHIRKKHPVYSLNGQEISSPSGSRVLAGSWLIIFR